MNNLERIIAENMAKICKEQQPGLFSAIQNLVSQGCSPKRIEREVGKQGVVKDLVFHTAQYLKESK